MPEAGNGRTGTLSLAVDLPGPAATQFDAVVTELVDGLDRIGLRFVAGPGGTISDGDRTVGTVVAWTPGREARIAWLPAPWTDGGPCELRLRVEPRGTDCRLAWDVDGWEPVLAASGNDASEWVGGALLPSLIDRVSPTALAAWITDTLARRPSGQRSRATYRDPTFHWPNFLLILDRIRLSSDDRLLEVACGGGAFLGRALASGCRAVGVDHSPQMLAVAAETNRTAIADGRLVLHRAEADRLPVPSAAFTCVVCTGAFGFFPDPEAAMAEMARALRPGGRLAIFVGTAELRGTPAAPEPIASQIRWYTPVQMTEFCRAAGLVDVRTDAPDLEPYARRAGVPDEALPLFRAGTGSCFLWARKPGAPDSPQGSPG